MGGHLKLCICVALLVAVNASHKEKFRYDTEYSEVHKKSTSVVVSKYQDLHDFSFSSYVNPHKNSKGRQTIFSHYESQKKCLFAVIFDHTKKKIHLQVDKESKEIDYEVKKGEWSHFALTRSSQNGNFIVYVGGKKVSTVKNFAKSFVFSGQGSLAIAQYQTEKKQYKEEERFVGKISEANFYEKVLTESQVTKLSQYQDLEESEVKEAISWSKSFGQDGQTQIGPSTVPGYTKTCKKETSVVTKDQGSSSSESESSSKGGSQDSSSQESGSSQTTTKQVCTLHYDLVFPEEATDAVAEPQNVRIESDFEKYSTSFYSYVEDTSKESTFVSYASDREEDSVSIGQKGGRFVYWINNKDHYLEEQTTAVKSKEWVHYGMSWVSETGEVKVYQNGKKIGVLKNIKKGKKFSKNGVTVLGQRQTTKRKYVKESRCHGRISRFYSFQDELTDEEFKQLSSKTESFKTKKTTLITTTTTYSYSGLSQFSETTLTESSISQSSSSSSSSSSEQPGSGSSESGSKSGESGSKSGESGSKSGENGDNSGSKGSDEENGKKGDKSGGSGENGGKGSGEGSGGKKDQSGDSGENGSKGSGEGSGEKGDKSGGSGENGGESGGKGSDEKGDKSGGNGENGGKSGGKGSGEKGDKSGGSGENGGKSGGKGSGEGSGEKEDKSGGSGENGGKTGGKGSGEESGEKGDKGGGSQENRAANKNWFSAFNL